MIFPYSPKKRKAKIILLYSVLNPETSSLSPSAKSKGERLVSATIVINQKIKIKIKIKLFKKNLVLFLFILKD